MSAAQAYFELYKTLPKKVRKEVLELIEENTDEIVSISLKALTESIEQVKLLKAGKAVVRPIQAILDEINADSHNK